MMRSLFSGVAGLRTHQTRMDVIGNNIANVNTTAYKSQSMTFSDLMYQTTRAASGANAVTGVGGVNARQIGLGSKTGAIKTAIADPGSAQSTNDPFDIMISGDAFFVVSNGSENFFTRDGSFYIDGAGNLAMTSNGYNVMGWKPDPQDPGNIKRDTVQALKIMDETNMKYPPAATTQAVVSGSVDKYDTDINSRDGKRMNLEIYDNQGYKYTVRLSTHAVDGDTGIFYTQLDDVLDSNGKSIITDANRDAFVFGSGTAIKDADGNVVKKTIVGADGKEQEVDVTNAVIMKYKNGEGTFEYVGDSAEANATGAPTADLTINLPNFQKVTIDFSTTTNYNVNKVSTLNAEKGGRDNGIGSGRPIGELSGITVQKDGMIYADYDNGQTKLLGQIAVATFANPSGLAKEGDNLYSATMNSGEFNGIGVDITQGGGYMESGVLEMSNVDLSSEFTQMITTQRGFQANSRIITVSDTLLEELTNLKR